MFYPRMRNPSISLQLQQSGDENGHPRVDTAPRGVEIPPHQLVADWLALMEPARGKSCPSGERRGPAAPGEDNFPSPDQKSFHLPTNPTTRGRKQISPGSVPPRRIWNPQPHGVVADWRRLMDPARVESCTSGQRRLPAALREDQVLSPNQKSFHIPTTPTTRGRKRRFRGLMSPRRVWNPRPTGWLLIG